MAEPTLTDEQAVEYVLAKLGQAADSALAEHADVVWLLTARHGVLGQNVRLLAFELGCIDFLLSTGWEEVDYAQQDASEKSSQKGANLRELRKLLAGKLALAEAAAAGGAVAAVGAITKQTPIVVTSGPDPSARRYRGDPICR